MYARGMSTREIVGHLRELYGIDVSPDSNDEAAMKLLLLVLNRSEKEWKMPPRERAMAKAQFAVLFGERFLKALAG